MVQGQVTSVFVGRQREVRDLLEALDDAVSGRGRLILVGGEPGIGKSRLADELATRAQELGHQVLWGRGWEDAGAPPFWPWVQALRAYLRSTSLEDVRRHMGPGAADIAQMLPELGTLIPDLPPRPADSESARFQLFDSVATLLRNAALDRPILVILDDLQAADTPSIMCLRFIATQVSDMRLLLVGTYRDVELTPDHPLTSALAEVAREPAARIVLLGGLEASAVAEVIGATAGVAPHDQLSAAVWRATNGNPLFVGEAIRLLSAEGRLGTAGNLPELRVAIPAGVRAVIARRIGHLDDATARALGLGAALGPEFDLEVLRRVGELEVDQALDILDDAMNAGLLLPVGGARGRYRFSHDLVRETLYQELPRGDRARLHRRIADVLEELHASGSGENLAELAFHYVQASPRADGADPEDDGAVVSRKAVEYARLAGDHAAGSLAYEEAARLYRMALDVMDQSWIADDSVRTETLLALGDVQTRTGDLDNARTAFLSAADIAKRTGVGPHLAHAALGFGGRHQWARPGMDSHLIPLLQDALVLLGGQDERLRARLLSRLACAWRSSPERRDDSATLSRQAIEIARGLDDPGTLTYTLAGRFWATWWPENPEERQEIAREMLAIAKPLGDGERIADAHFMSFLTLSELGRMSEARAEMATLGRVIEELRQPAQVWLAPVNRSAIALLEGDYAQAEESVAQESRSDYRITPGRDEVSAARMHRFLIRREQRRVAEEEATIRRSVDDFPWYPLFRAALACLLLDLDKVAEARHVLEGLAANEFAALNRDNEWLLGMSLASEACARLGDVQAAATLYEQLAPFAGRHAIGHAEGSVGAVDRYLGLLAATLGRLDDAAQHLAAAIDLNERMGARPWAAHCQRDLAGVLVRRDGPGDRARASDLDRTALATARTLGMALGQEAQTGALEPSRGPGETPFAIGTFHQEGEYWSIEYGRDSFRVRDSKGMRHLAHLLEAPGRELHAIDLARSESAGGNRSTRSEPGISVGGADQGMPMLDAEAKASYRRRLTDLRAELAEADRWHDPERVARLQVEEQALAHELSTALGLGGRDRSAAAAPERARLSVTRAIRAAMARINEQSAQLGAHLAATVHTGTYCSYVPDPRAPITWRR